jgi:hypothetical protein
MVDRIVDDVLERRLVLVLRLDQLRREAAAEDVVAAAVPLIERTCVLAIEVAHAVRKIRKRRLDDEVVVVAHQAARVQLPAVSARDATQDVDERVAILVVEHNRRAVVAARRHVIVGASGDETGLATHRVRR